MPYKICAKCQSISYSASSLKQWFCPICHTDISREPASDHFPYYEKGKKPPLGEQTDTDFIEDIIKWLKAQ